MCLLWSTNWVFISQMTIFFIDPAVKTTNLTVTFHLPLFQVSSYKQFFARYECVHLIGIPIAWCAHVKRCPSSDKNKNDLPLRAASGYLLRVLTTVLWYRPVRRIITDRYADIYVKVSVSVAKHYPWRQSYGNATAGSGAVYALSLSLSLSCSHRQACAIV
jgi:hypothetical protein